MRSWSKLVVAASSVEKWAWLSWYWLEHWLRITQGTGFSCFYFVYGFFKSFRKPIQCFVFFYWKKLCLQRNFNFFNPNAFPCLCLFIFVVFVWVILVLVSSQSWLDVPWNVSHVSANVPNQAGCVCKWMAKTSFRFNFSSNYFLNCLTVFQNRTIWSQ